MIRPRWKKVLSDLWSSKVRSLLVIASIAVGLFAIGMIATTYTILSQDMKASYAAVHPANIQVRVEAFDQDMLERIRHLDGVREADGVRVVDMRLEKALGEWITINLKAIPDFDRVSVNRFQPVSGAAQPADRQILIETNKLGDTNANLGAEVVIKLPSGKTRSLRLVGVVHDQTIGSLGGGGGFFLAPAQGYITLNTLEWMEQPTDLNLLTITVTGDANNLVAIRAVSDRVIHELEQNGCVVLNSVLRRSIDHPNGTYVDAISGILFVLGLLVVFLSGFLITNTLSALLNQQIRQIGVMKTLGARRKQITGIYMALIFVFSLLAFLIALPLAQRAAFWQLGFLAGKINFNLQGYRVIPASVILQAVIALVVPQVAGAMPILRGAKLTVQEAISGLGTGTGEQQDGWLNRRSRLTQRLSRPLLISLRNTFRRKFRLALTLITLMLGGAIFISTFIVRTSLEQYVARLGKYFLADVNLTFDRPYRIDDIDQVVRQMPSVELVEGWAFARVELLDENDNPGESVQVLAPPADSKLVEPILKQGRWIQPGDRRAIVINELFTDRFPGIKVSDTLRLKVNGEKTTWVIVGFFQFAGKSSGLTAYTTYEYLSELTHMTHKAYNYRIVSATPLRTSEEQKALGRQIETHLEELGYHVSDVSAGLSLQDSTSKGFNILTTFLLVMALLTAVVGSIGLSGTMSLNVMERTREIGILRAIGASDRIVMNLVIVEGILIGLMSWLLGCLLAIPISKLMSDVISMALFNTTSNFYFSFNGIFIWLGVVLLLSIVASVLPARSAAQLTIREVLAYE